MAHHQLRMIIMLLGNSLCSLVTEEAGHLLCEVFPSNMFATG